MNDIVDKQIDKCILSIKWLMVFLGFLGSGFAATTKYASFIIKLLNIYILDLIIILEFAIIVVIVIFIIVNFLTIKKINLKDR